MQKKLRALSKIGERDPEFVLAAGSIEDADKWNHLIGELAEMAGDQSETLGLVAFRFAYATRPHT